MLALLRACARPGNALNSLVDLGVLQRRHVQRRRKASMMGQRRGAESESRCLYAGVRAGVWGGGHALCGWLCTRGGGTDLVSYCEYPI